jgi:hypothetical protein
MGAWSDFMARFKSPASPQDDPGSYIDVSAGPALSPSKPPPPAKSRGWLARWRPGSKRDRQIAWLQAGYHEMLELMRGIRAHLDRQEDVQHKMVEALEHLPGSLDGLKSVGRAAEQQVEVLGLLREQIEAGVRHDAELVDSMNRFNETLGVLDNTSRASGRTVADLVEKAQSSEHLLREVIERSERRFLFISLTFVVVVLLSIGAALYFVSVNPAALQRLAKASAHHPARTAAEAEAGWPEPKVSTAAELDEVDVLPESPAAAEETMAESAQPARGGFLHKWFHRPKPVAAPTQP